MGGGRATGLVIGDTAIPFRCIMPIGAGLIVAYLQSWGFSPALKFLTRAIEGVVDDSKNAALPTSYWQVRQQQAYQHIISRVIHWGRSAFKLLWLHCYVPLEQQQQFMPDVCTRATGFAA